MVLLGLALLALSVTPAFAQTGPKPTSEGPDGSPPTQTIKKDGGGTAPGAAGGVIVGALLGGPIGAVLGGISGATIGHTLAPPTEVRTYVLAQPLTPGDYSGVIVVGKILNGEIVWSEVPNHPTYRWACLNGQRVVVDADSHRVLAVY